MENDAGDGLLHSRVEKKLESRSVRDAAGECLDLFMSTNSAASSTNAVISDTSSNDTQPDHGQLRIEQDRFGIWAANALAFATGPSSLDYQLKEFPQELDMVKSLLDIISTRLESYKSALLDIIKLGNPNDPTSEAAFGIKASPPSSVREDDITLTDGPRTGADSADLTVSKNEAFNYTEALESIHISIDWLSRLCNMLRGASFVNQNLRAHSNSVPEFDGTAFKRLYAFIVGRDFPRLSEQLKDRIATTMVERHRRILYRRNRFGPGWKQQTSYEHRVEQNGPESTTDVNSSPPPQVNFVSETRLLTEMEVTSDQETDAAPGLEYRGLITEPARPRYHASSSMSTARPNILDGDTKLLIPPPQPQCWTNDEFMCDYCCVIMDSKIGRNKVQWREHVRQDLDTYVCLFDNCNFPHDVYSSKKEWLGHMSSEHLIRWTCNSIEHDDELEFLTRSELEEHMRESHATIFSEDVLEACRTTAEVIFESCPLCDEKHDAIEEHITNHLQYLSLKSIPWPEHAADLEADEKDISNLIIADLFVEMERTEQSLRSFQHDSIGQEDGEYSPFDLEEQKLASRSNTSETPDVNDDRQLEWGFIRNIFIEHEEWKILKKSLDLTVANLATEPSDSDHEILHWLAPIDYGLQQSEYLAQRRPGAGQWFLESKEFQRWLDTSGQAMFCPGIPKTGTSIITSIVVDLLTSKFGIDPKIGLAYIYYDSRRPRNEQTADNLLMNVLKQLTKSRHQRVKYLYAWYESKVTQPSVKEILRALHSIMATYSKVFIVIDALDEIQASDNHHKVFISFLLDFQVRHKINIFATSRYILEGINLFKNSILLEIHTWVGDAKTYIAQPPLSIQQDSLPQEEDSSPELIMERICRSDSTSKELAMRVLPWITYTKRELTALELQHALATKRETSELAADDLISIEEIISSCAGVIMVGETGHMQFSQHRMREYFKATRDLWFPGAESIITDTCVTYLSFSIFEVGFCETHEKFEERLRTYPFYNYAANNWGYHALRGVGSKWRLVNFLMSEAKVEASSQALFVGKRRYCLTFSIDERDKKYYSQQVPRRMTGLHLAGFFGMAEMVDYLLFHRGDPNQPDSHGQTPLSWAAERGCEAVVKLLLEGGANLEAGNLCGETPLMTTLKNGNEAIAKYLLEEGANIEAEDISGKTPLMITIQSGHETTTKFLLDKGANLEAKTIFGETPLLMAVFGGYKSIIELLLERGATPKEADRSGETPLLAAVQGGHEAVAKLLIDRGVDIEAKDVLKRTPLIVAAQGGRDAIVKLLLEKGANIEAKDRLGRTPLLLATENGHSNTIRLLLDRFANPGSNTGSIKKSSSISGKGGHEMAKDVTETGLKNY